METTFVQEVTTDDVLTALATLPKVGVVDVSYNGGYPMVRMVNLAALREIVRALTGEKQILKMRRDYGQEYLEYSYEVNNVTYYFSCKFAPKGKVLQVVE